MDTQALVVDIPLGYLISDNHSLSKAREEKKTRSQKDNQDNFEITPMTLHNEKPFRHT